MSVYSDLSLTTAGMFAQVFVGSELFKRTFGFLTD